MPRYQTTYDTVDKQSRLVSVPVTTTTRSYFTRTTVQGDTFASLALEHLNDERLYWLIAEYNPQINFPDSINPGTVVRIPLL
jgi:nucleoid-associated protein YgaU